MWKEHGGGERGRGEEPALEQPSLEAVRAKYEDWRLRLVPLAPGGNKALTDPEKIDPLEEFLLEKGLQTLSSPEIDLLGVISVGFPNWDPKRAFGWGARAYQGYSPTDIARAFGHDVSTHFEAVWAIERKLNPTSKEGRYWIPMIARYLGQP